MAEEKKIRPDYSKGHYGYLKRRKMRLLLQAGILFTGVASLYLVGWLTLHTYKNWLTVVAAISAIPMAMSLATLFSILKYKGRPLEEWEAVRKIVGNGCLNTELVISNKDGKAMEFNYVYLHEDGIYVYTTDLKMDMVKTPDYIRNYLRLNNCDGKVYIFNDLKAYQRILRNLSPMDRATAPDLVLQQEGVIRAISM